MNQSKNRDNVNMKVNLAENESSVMRFCSDGKNLKSYFTNITTLEDVLKVFSLGNILSDLDKDLEVVKACKKSMKEHNKYFSQVDNQIKKLSVEYHPDKIRNKGGATEEILQAEEIQKIINAVREVLKNLNENASRYPNLKYSSFARIDISILKNQQGLREMSYSMLTKLSELAEIKNRKLIPNFNQFLKSSQASMKSFAKNDAKSFLKEKDQAFIYFNNYLADYKNMVADVSLLRESYTDNRQYINIVEDVLNESNIQLDILGELSSTLKQSNADRNEEQRSYFIDYKYGERQADRCTLACIEYINILLICNELYLSEKAKKKNGILGYVISKLCNSGAIYDCTPSVDEQIKVIISNDLSLLHRVCSHLVRYCCYNSEKDGKIIASIYSISSINTETAVALFVKVVNTYADYLAKEFQPEENPRKKITEVQEVMEELFNKFMKVHEQCLEEYSRVMNESIELHKSLKDSLSNMNETLQQECERGHALMRKYREDSERQLSVMNEMFARYDDRISTWCEEHKELVARTDKAISEISKVHTLLLSAGGSPHTEVNESLLSQPVQSLSARK